MIAQLTPLVTGSELESGNCRRDNFNNFSSKRIGIFFCHHPRQLPLRSGVCCVLLVCALHFCCQPVPKDAFVFRPATRQTPKILRRGSRASSSLIHPLGTPTSRRCMARGSLFHMICQRSASPTTGPQTSAGRIQRSSGRWRDVSSRSTPSRGTRTGMGSTRTGTRAHVGSNATRRSHFAALPGANGGWQPRACVCLS